jgi:hypothetical protein
LLTMQNNPDPDYYFDADEYLDMIETILGWYEDTIWQY